MRKPIIGITMNYVRKDSSYRLDINEANINVITDNGGIPIMLPFTDKEEIINTYIEMVDGIYFSGGNDILPLYYNEEPIKELRNFTPERDEFEINIFKKSKNKKIPIMG